MASIAHLIRHSMEFASWKDRKAIAGELRTVYRAKDAEAGEAALNAFDVGPSLVCRKGRLGKLPRQRN